MKEKPVEGFLQRDLLIVVSSLFDPLVLLSPFSIRIKKVLKLLWKSEGYEWDKTISKKKNAEEFESCRKKPTKIRNIIIPKNYFSFIPTETISTCSLLLLLKYYAPLPAFVHQS